MSFQELEELQGSDAQITVEITDVHSLSIHETGSSGSVTRSDEIESGFEVQTGLEPENSLEVASCIAENRKDGDITGRESEYSTNIFPVGVERKRRSRTPGQSSRTVGQFQCHICGRFLKRLDILLSHEETHTGVKPFQCEICGVSRHRRFDLVMHIKKIHGGLGLLNCKLCDRSFLSKCNLTKHERSHEKIKESTSSEPQDYQPGFEEGVLNSQSGLTDQKESSAEVMTEKSGILECNVCFRRFQNARKLKLHEINHSRERLFKCKTCDKSFFTEYTLYCHEQIHEGVKPHKCKVCDKPFLRIGDLNKHYRIHADMDIKSETLGSCSEMSIVPTSSTTASDLGTPDVTLQTHSTPENESYLQNSGDGMPMSDGAKSTSTTMAVDETRKFTCRICGKNLKTAGHRYTHEKRHSGQRPYKCEVCQKAFFTKSALNDHLKIHLGIKSHECNVCKRAFGRRSDLKKHSLIHTKIRRVKYKRPAAELSALNMSDNEPSLPTSPKTNVGTISMVSNETKNEFEEFCDAREFKCDFCGRSYKNKYRLNAHLKTHSSGRNYKCRSCDRSFFQKWHLDEHELIHLGVRPFKCDSCDRSFTRKREMRKHLERTHRKTSQ